MTAVSSDTTAPRRSGTTIPPLVLNTALLGVAATETKLDLAAASGFAGVEVWLHEVAPQLLTDADAAELDARFAIRADRSPIATEALKKRAKGHGLAIDGLIPGTDALMRWSARLDDVLLADLAATLDVCAALDGRYLVLPTVAPGGTLHDVAASLRKLAPYARERGILLGLEPIGQCPLMPTVADAMTVLDTAGLGPDEAGIILDAFHFFRAGQTLDDLARLDPGQIVTVQINDALDLPLRTLVGNRHRDYPGQGVFDVAGFCAAVLARGYNGPFAVEVINPALMALPPRTTCGEAFTASAEVLRRAMARQPAAAGAA